MTIVTCLLLALCVSDDLVARTATATYTRAEFGEWLVQRFGSNHLRDFVLEQVVLAEAEREHVLPTEADVEQAYLSERDAYVARYFGGDLARYERDLRSRDRDPEQEASRRRTSLLGELALDRLARRSFAPSDDQLRQHYKDVFGESGERVSFDVLFYSLYADLEPDDERPERSVLEAAAEARALAAQRQLQQGRPARELVAASDPIPSEFVRDGRVTRHRRKLLGPEVDAALASLDEPGDVAGPLAVWDGYFVLQLVERLPVSFDEVRAELEELARQAPLTAEQLQRTQDELWARSGAEALLP